jgi:hypothetical protein
LLLDAFARIGVLLRLRRILGSKCVRQNDLHRPCDWNRKEGAR